MKNGFAFIELLAAICVAGIGIAALLRLTSAAGSSVTRLKPALVDDAPLRLECSSGQAPRTLTCTVNKHTVTILGAPSGAIPL